MALDLDDDALHQRCVSIFDGMNEGRNRSHLHTIKMHPKDTFVQGLQGHAYHVVALHARRQDDQKNEMVVGRVVSDDSLGPGEVQVGTWIRSFFDELQVKETWLCPGVEPSSCKRCHKLSFSLLRCSSAVTGSTLDGSQENLFPMAVRNGKIDLAGVVSRQLRNLPLHIHGLFALSILNKSYICKVASMLDEENHSMDIGVVTTNVACSLVPEGSRVDNLSSIDDSMALFSIDTSVKSAFDHGLGGYQTLLQKLIKQIILFAEGTKLGSHFEFGRLLSSRGILLHGHFGIGKSTMLEFVKRIFEPFQVKCCLVKGSSLNDAFLVEKTSSALDFLYRTCGMQGFHGSRTHFRLILIDDLDLLFSGDTFNSHGANTGLGHAFLRLLDQCHEDKNRVCFVATTSSLEKIPSSCRRQGRLDKTFEIPVPTEEDRYDMARVHFKSQLKTNLDELSNECLYVARMTGGFVAKDLVKLFDKAYLDACFKSRDPSQPISIQLENIIHAQHGIQPSQLRDLNVQTPSMEKPSPRWGGYPAMKEKIRQLMFWKFDHMNKIINRPLNTLHFQPISGILLYGPSGCGKTMLVRILAAEVRANFVQVKATDLMSKYLGESERMVRDLFARARSASPCILFFDELDSITQKRSFSGKEDSPSGGTVHARILSTFLNEMDGVDRNLEGVLVFAATNRIDALDPALLRPGRLDQKLEMRLPNIQDRLEIFQVCTKEMPLHNNVDLAFFAHLADGCTGADIANVCKEAGLFAIRESQDATSVTLKHFHEAWDKRTKRRQTWLGNSKT